VPTVATRNGGPVDIMKTLHHGVVCDAALLQSIERSFLFQFSSSLCNPEFQQFFSSSSTTKPCV